LTQSDSDSRVSCGENWQIVPNGLLRAIKRMSMEAEKIEAKKRRDLKAKRRAALHSVLYKT
jgi:hypothetical protein